MHLKPRPPEIPENIGFDEKNDLFRRREFGERLTNLLLNVDDPTVFLLDGEWGSGKTYFAKQIREHLKGQGVPVVYFDAFANDLDDDPFISLASEVTSLLESSGASDVKKSFSSKAAQVFRALLPLGIKIGIRAASINLLSKADLEDTQKILLEETNDAIADRLEAYVEDRLQEQANNRAIINDFRDLLSKAAVTIAENRDDTIKPVIFIIDELDRCDPAYGTRLLERVKHLFSVQNVQFLLVGHLPQMANAIKHVHGSETDARRYLEKFYDYRIVMPADPSHDISIANRYIRFLIDNLEIPKNQADAPIDDIIGLLSLMSESHHLELRTIEKITTHLALGIAAATRGYPFYTPLIIGLCLMRHLRSDLYAKARNRTLTWGEVEKFLLLPERSEETSYDWLYEWWKYATDEPMDSERKQPIRNALLRYKTLDGRHLLASMASLLDNLHIS